MSPLLNESTIKEICDELSKRNLNFVFAAEMYDGPEDDQMPFISFGIKQEFLIKMLGIIELAKTQLIEEFNNTTEVYREEETDDDEQSI